MKHEKRVCTDLEVKYLGEYLDFYVCMIYIFTPWEFALSAFQSVNLKKKKNLSGYIFFNV